MKTSRMVLSLVLAALAFAVVAGCRHPAPPAEQADNLTLGKVQGEIKIGMDAASVAQILGSPNIVTTDDQRREVWIYDKVSSESVDTANSFGGSIIILGGQTSQRQSSKNQKTLTIIIKFDEDKRVRDFGYNYSQF
jgi:outer membrane protein assembly factor BamE (lipoprotein component of BamABCDE complex)